MTVTINVKKNKMERSYKIHGGGSIMLWCKAVGIVKEENYLQTLQFYLKTSQWLNREQNWVVQ